MLVLSWCEQNRLKLNVDKCKIMTFSRRSEIFSYDYECDGMRLERHTVLRDLGVLFDTELSFVEHISQIVLDAARVYGFMVRNCRDFTEINCLKILYNAVIRSKLEYASVVWSPIYECHKKKLECVQRRFMKFLLFKTDGVYPPQGCDGAILCERTGYLSLEMRRVLASLSFLFNVVHYNVDCSEILSKVNFNVPTFNSRTVLVFKPGRARTNILQKAPITKMCENFNSFCVGQDIFSSSRGNLVKSAIHNFSGDLS